MSFTVLIYTNKSVLHVDNSMNALREHPGQRFNLGEHSLMFWGIFDLPTLIRYLTT